jgi:ABC-type Fe3+/spermidine/putrescine transport system ATPase subunit
MSTALALENVTKRYGQVKAVDGITLRVQRGEFLSVLGPSGSGKTTVQRLIGGFEQPDSGSISILDQGVETLPPYRRDTATVFQSGALFPHKTVFENVAYGLHVRKVAKPEITRRVRKALDIVRLSGVEERYPSQISGGQKQRVALARALVVEPAVVLFDEPLSALDLTLRVEMRTEIKALHTDLGFTAIYVTHDQSEAMAMSDRIAVMRSGRVEQLDTPERIFAAPASEFVFRFIGESSFLPVQVDGRGISVSGEPVAAPCAKALPQGSVRLFFRPSWLHVGDPAEQCENRLPVRVKFVEFLGNVYRYHLDAGSSVVVVDRRNPLGVPVGTTVTLGWNSSEMMVFQ